MEGAGGTQNEGWLIEPYKQHAQSHKIGHRLALKIDPSCQCVMHTNAGKDWLRWSSLMHGVGVFVMWHWPQLWGVYEWELAKFSVILSLVTLQVESCYAHDGMKLPLNKMHVTLCFTHKSGNMPLMLWNRRKKFSFWGDAKNWVWVTCRAHFRQWAACLTETPKVVKSELQIHYLLHGSLSCHKFRAAHGGLNCWLLCGMPVNWSLIQWVECTCNRHFRCKIIMWVCFDACHNVHNNLLFGWSIIRMYSHGLPHTEFFQSQSGATMSNEVCSPTLHPMALCFILSRHPVMCFKWMF